MLPLSAPAALILAGSLGAATDALRAGDDHIGPITIGSGRALAGFVEFGLVGTVGEAWLMHFRGAFQNPAMLLPVVLPPVAAIALARGAIRGEPAPVTASCSGPLRCSASPVSPSMRTAFRAR